MGRMKVALAAILLLFAFAGAARAENCDAPTYTVWSAPNAGGWTGSPCTPASGDTFRIQSGDTVVVTALLAFSSGTTIVECQSGGTLRIMPGAGFNWTGGAGGYLDVQDGCNYQPRGSVVWEGRLGSEVTHATGPARATFTAAGGGSPTAVATTSDWLYFDRELESLGFVGSIVNLVQTVTGFPLAGYLRPSYNGGAWYPIQAVSSTSVTYYTNTWADVDGGTATGTTATSPYGGTRGPALTTPTALAGNVRVRGGFLTKLQLDLAGVTMDGDLGSQYVVFTSGDCAGKRVKIVGVDANTSPTADDVYVDGDASACGLANVTIDFGARRGDAVKLIRPVIINGGNVAHVRFGGASIAAEWVLYRNLGAATISGVAGRCNLCVYKQAAGSPAPTGYMRNHANILGDFGGAQSSAVGALGLFNWNSGVSNYTRGTGERLDLGGLLFSGWYVADTRANGTGAGCPATCEGIHGVLAEGVENGRFEDWRVERITDDGIAWIADDFDQGHAQSPSVKRWAVYEIWTTDTLETNSNSQQCLDLTGGQSDGTQTTLTRGTVQDFIGVGCKDGILSAKILNTTFDRMLVGMSRGGAWSLGVSGHNALPTGALGTYPNRIRNSKLYQLNTTAATNFQLGGVLEDSIIAGNVIGTANGVHISSPVGFYRSFIDLGNDTGSSLLMDRFNGQEWGKIATVPIVDSVFLLSSAGDKTLTAINGNCSGEPCFDLSPAATIQVDRSIFGVTQVAASGGFLADGTVSANWRLSGSNIVVGVTTASAGGMRGLEATGNGANIARACVETTLANALTNGANFGSSRTATSIELSLVRPNPPDDVPLSTWTQRVSPLCDPPASLGLRQVGPQMLLGGDLAIDSIANASTSESLLRSIIGTGGAGGPYLGPISLGP